MLKKWQINTLEGLSGWDEFVKSAPAAPDPDKKKQQLLEMARNGEPRPNKHHGSLGIALCSYTNKCSNYDAKFDKEIRKLAADWFVDTAAEKKQRLMEMARNGGSRPNKHHGSLGMALCNYTNKGGNNYDAKFDKEIRKLAADWFVDTAAENKKQLLEMAKRGESRPHHKKHSLGAALARYTMRNRGCYDLVFDKQIRQVAPHWFVNSAVENKKQLLEMARNGEERPNYRKHPLGQAFGSYLCKKHNTYDPEFDKEIRELAPHWFVDVTAENKRKLLKMAKCGELRPAQRKCKIGVALCGYIYEDGTAYDPEFDKQIRKLAPHWFKKGK